MAKVQYLDPIDHISGKISKKHRTVYYYRSGTGAKYTGIYSPSDTEPTAAQKAATEKFRQVVNQVNRIMSDPQQAEPYRQSWKAQIYSGNTRYKTLRGYIFAQVYKTL